MNTFKLFYEARSHAELNPTVYAYEVLQDYFNSPESNLFVTFVDIPKIGINPKSEWNSPSGIYAYQKDSWDFYKVPSHKVPLKELFPYAADRKYMVIFKLKSMDNVVYVDSYSNSNYNDVVKLRAFLSKSVSESMLDFIQARAETDAYKQHPFSYLWNFTRLLSKYELKKRVKKENSDYEEYDINIHGNMKNYKFNIPSRRSAIWNNLLKNVLGYSAFIDNGYKMIDLHEEMQTLILDKSNISVIDFYLNKSPRVIIPNKL